MKIIPKQIELHDSFRSARFILSYGLLFVFNRLLHKFKLFSTHIHEFFSRNYSGCRCLNTKQPCSISFYTDVSSYSFTNTYSNSNQFSSQ